MKYSCALWPPGTSELAQADGAMLDDTCRRAEIEDGRRSSTSVRLGQPHAVARRALPERAYQRRLNSSTRTAYIDHETAGAA